MATQPASLSSQYQAYAQPPQYDQYGNPIPQGGAPSNPYGSGTSVNAGPYGNPYATTTPGLATSDTVNNSNFYNDQSIEYAQENQLEGENQAQESYYGPLQEQAQQQEEASLNQLNQQPGYTPQQSSQINADYSQYNTPTSALQQQFLTQPEQQGIAGDPNAPVSTLNSGLQGEGAMLNQYQANLGGEVANNDQGVGGAAQGLSTGLQNSQNFGQLNNAVDNSNLQFNANGPAGQEMSNADVQQMETEAGEQVGAQYQTAEDQLQRSAAAAGNTSPLAIGAANARLQTQEASDAGTATAQAEIAAQQAQYQRAQSIESQSLGAAQTQAGLQSQAAEYQQGQGQSAAALSGEENIAAAEEQGQTDVNAANAYGQFSTNTQGNIAGAQYGAADTAEQEEASRAAALATNRQQTQTGINQTQYSQGTGSQQMTAAGATNVGQTAIAGQGAYRAGEAQQQSLAQQGGETAVAGQQTAASTLGSQLNQSEANAGAFKNNSPSLAGQASGVISSLGSLGLAKGGIVTKPTEAVIGESGPEAVIPLNGRYRNSERRKAA